MGAFSVLMGAVYLLAPSLSLSRTGHPAPRPTPLVLCLLLYIVSSSLKVDCREGNLTSVEINLLVFTLLFYSFAGCSSPAAATWSSLGVLTGI